MYQFSGTRARPPVQELPVPTTHIEVSLEGCVRNNHQCCNFTQKRDGGALRDSRLLILGAFTATKSSTLNSLIGIKRL